MGVVWLGGKIVWGPRGSHFYFRSAGFQVKEETRWGAGGLGANSHQTRLSPTSSLLPAFPGASRPISPLSSETSWAQGAGALGDGGETKGEEGASSLPARSVGGMPPWLRSGEGGLTFTRPPALLAFCIYFSAFQTGSNLGAEVRKQGVSLTFSAQL